MSGICHLVEKIGYPVSLFPAISAYILVSFRIAGEQSHLSTTNTILRAGALGGLVSVVTLIAMAFISFPEGMRSPFCGMVSLILGILGAMFDFGENALVWGAIAQLRTGHLSDSDWAVRFRAVQQASYWFPYIAAVAASVGLWSKKPLHRIVGFVGTVSAAAAGVCLYLPDFEILSSAWFLLWFAVCAILLWRCAKERPR